MSTMDSARTAGVRSALAAASRSNQASAMAKAVAWVLVFAAVVCAAQPASAQFTQQGAKLVGSGTSGPVSQGYSVALSADGTTAIAGGFADNVGAGAAWVYTQSAGVWTQQGSNLVGSGAVGAAYQGISVALSADGNTAIVGGPLDNTSAGAAWVFTQGGNVKLVGSGAVGSAEQGRSVALSADGNTAIVGGPYDDSDAGAAWVFTQSGGVWTAGGTKLPLGTGAVGTADQGWSVALSADGNTAIVGGPGDNSFAGAAWVFTQSGGVWTQQGLKLVGAGAVGAAEQGISVALSADGNTAIIGGNGDNSDAGAAWVFTRSGGIWTQQGSKLFGSGAVGAAHQGNSVALSTDGNTAIVGGLSDNSDAGAAWVFTQSSGVWSQQGNKLVGSGAVGAASQGTSVALSGDGTTAIVGGPYDNGGPGAAWIFVSPVTVTSIFPTNGPAAGGTDVTITGTGFTGASAVMFGSTAAASFNVNSDSSITATSPAGSGTVDVTVTSGAATSPTSAADRFTYIPTLTLTSTASSAMLVGQSYSQTNVAGGGTTPYAYSLAAGTLPGGTTLNASTGTVAGTPTNAGAFSYTIKVTDSGSPAQTATQVISGTITACAAVCGPLAASPAAGQAPLAVTFRARDLTLPMTYTINFGDGASGPLTQGSCSYIRGAIRCFGSASHTYAAAGTYIAALLNASGGPLAAAKISVGANVAKPLVGSTATVASQPASAQFTQQGAKLVGSGAAGAASQGFSVALSADGDTAIVGGPYNNSSAGAAWVFSQSGGVWTQQESKLLGAGPVGAAEQGYSVALSADGNTAIVGGVYNNSDAGAAWVFGLGSNVELPLGTGAVGAAYQGYAVALSADGNTAIVGGPGDNSNAGAAWVFTQSGGVWTQQGSKLIGGGAIGNAEQGISVALSADGNTAIVGGYLDNTEAGAAWVYTRSGGVWTPGGIKLPLGTGVVGVARQGASVALSADGATAIVGGVYDNSFAGAAWVFTQSGGVWTQQGPKLVGSGAVGAVDHQGSSVALSADGNTAIVGGPYDNTSAGAAWVFTRSGGGVWTQQGSKLFGSGAVGAALQGYSVALSANGAAAIVGGYGDNSYAGAAWIFTAPSHIAGLLSATPTSGAAPLVVTFRATGLPLPMTYTINFGDGTSGALSQGSCFGSRSGVQCSGSASHGYSAGTYYATLVNASGSTLGAATITAGGNLVRPLRPPLGPRGTAPPVAISTPTPEQHSLGQ
jgi:hypothetical protein